MSNDPIARTIEEAWVRLDALRPRVEAGAPWPLAERFDHTPEASWGPPEILAHCLEMVDYWRVEIDRAASATGTDPTAFGRVASDAPRLAAIDRDRRLPAAELYERLDAAIERIVTQSTAWTPEQRARLGVHPTGDVLDVPAAVQRFIGGHLLAHASQLEAILDPTPSADPRRPEQGPRHPGAGRGDESTHGERVTPRRPH